MALKDPVQITPSLKPYGLVVQDTALLSLSKHTAGAARRTTGVRFLWSPELWSRGEAPQTAGHARLLGGSR